MGQEFGWDPAFPRSGGQGRRCGPWPSNAAETNTQQRTRAAAGTGTGTVQLPPEILLDRHLLRTERLLADGDNRLDGEVGYGLPVGRRFVGTPRVGISTSEYGRDYRVGYGLGLLDRNSLNVELGVDAQRRESPRQGGGADQAVVGRVSLGW